jgi:hypothetical protein
MAKKGKKFETTEGQEASLPVQRPPEVKGPPEGTNGSETQNGAAAEAVSPVRQSAYLQSTDGVQFQVTSRPDLPKRAGKIPDGDLKINVDGREYPAWVTSSKGWAADDKVIDYIWVVIPQAEGTPPVSGYITLDYLVPASNYAGHAFTLGFGKSPRTDPPRVPKNQETEDNRKLLFAQTMAKKKAEQPEQPEGSEAEGEGAEEGAEQ